LITFRIRISRTRITALRIPAFALSDKDVRYKTLAGFDDQKSLVSAI
jgi:hypothetical protein